MKIIKCFRDIKNVPRRLSIVLPLLLYILFISFILNVSYPLKSLTSTTINTTPSILFNSKVNNNEINNNYEIMKTAIIKKLDETDINVKEKSTNKIKSLENKQLEMAFYRYNFFKLN